MESLRAFQPHKWKRALNRKGFKPVTPAQHDVRKG
jgi:hypothetical protein